MFIIFGILILIMLLSLKINKKIDDNYLSMDNTFAIKGIFVVLIFLSHIRAYAIFDYALDIYVIKILDLMSQLVVIMFLFYSGYGIYESIKTKKYYIKHFPKHRLAYVFINLVMGLCLYMILNVFIHRSYSIGDILLSFVVLKSIGNSSWFMFAILVLYLTTYFSFKIFKEDKKSIVNVSVLSIVYVIVMTYFDYSPRYSCTHLCFGLGMWYSYYRSRIDAYFNKKISLYYITTTVIGVLMIVSAIIISSMSELGYFSNLFYNIIAMLFSLFIVMCTMKISFHSHILVHLGKRAFWYYILQRLPMNLFEYLHINDHVYMFLFLTILILAVLVEFMNAISTKSRDKFLV